MPVIVSDARERRGAWGEMVNAAVVAAVEEGFLARLKSAELRNDSMLK